ncbi:hypothetical protein R1flu_016534 [Riccia fluitans]|uniref:Uncharacterized protein n=1 Tax=Riccia fluitans TaxID=41844 RepID=A0ABD1YM45_9MARC
MTGGAGKATRGIKGDLRKRTAQRQKEEMWPKDAGPSSQERNNSEKYFPEPGIPVPIRYLADERLEA